MKLAFVFPGQGSHSVGMLSEIAKDYKIIPEIFEEASQALGYDLQKLINENSNNDLNKTEFTQPAILASSYALWKIWNLSGGNMPFVLAGHSLGEYTALVCSDSISFADGLRLVCGRGKLMQSAVEEGRGAMAAIVGLPEDKTEEICKECSSATGEILSPANYNSPGHVVISGGANAVKMAIEIAKKNGVKMAKLLDVSVPSHSEMMKPVAEKLKELIFSIKMQKPKINIIHNADVECYEDIYKIRDAIIRQIYSPLRWTETVNVFTSKFSIDTIIECGPGKVLTGLNKRINPNLYVNSIFSPATLKECLDATK